MDLGIGERAKKLASDVREFMDFEVEPNESVYRDQIIDSGNPYCKPPIMYELQAKARSAGLWNLFLPQTEWGGSGLSNLDFMPICEYMGRSLIGPEALNCHPPESGNMGLLADYGTPAQQEQWLVPLLDATIGSCFAMTEPDVASSDANNISARIEREGDNYRINARKAPSTGGARDICKVSILMGVTDPSAEPFMRQSMILVPLDSAGVTVARSLTVFGDHWPISQSELLFEDVLVPAANLISTEGSAFGVSQARLGPGRLHHCMRLIGIAERALELLCRRVSRRETFGKKLSEQGVIQDWIGRSRIEIEQARLLTMKTAWMMDELGADAARQEIAAIKVVAPAVALDVVDRAIQAHGAAGVTQDTPLAGFWASARTLRIADGPDEVHIRSLARWELKRQLDAGPA
jgi:acyl-CoA dehydrogenase